MSKTKIVVLRMKEVVYTAVFVGAWDFATDCFIFYVWQAEFA